MNYIPGFSNYLQASVPRYADGGAVMGGAPIMDAYQQGAVAPTTQAAAAPYDLSSLAGVDLSSLYGLNLGGPGNTGLAGLPSLGAGYVPMFEEQLITAPISNKGNPTAYGVNNQFYMSPNNLVRIIDRSTNKVLFEGVGYDAAKKAVEIGQNLTDTMGRSASYQIETGTTPDNYAPVANEKYNPSTISKIGKVAGTVAPLAMALIPGANLTLLGSKLAGGVAAGALIGGASAGLKGDNILKGAALGGLTAYGGQALGPVVGSATGASSGLARAIGTGIGATAGGLATGKNLQNSLLGGVVSGGLSYVAPSIQRELGIGQGPNVSAGGGGDAAPVIGGPNAPIIVSATPSFTPSVNLGGYKTPAQKYVGETAEPTTEDILVNARSSFTPPVNLDLSTVPTGGLNTVTEPTTDEILVNARKAFTPPVNLDLSTIPTGGLNTVTEPTTEEILVNARKAFTPPVDLSVPTTPTGGLDAVTAPELEEILVKGRETFTPPVNLTIPTGPTTPTGGLDTVTPTELEEILVKGRETLTPPVTVGTPPAGGTDVVDDTIKVTGRKTEPGPPITIDTPPAADDPKKAADEAEKKKKLGVEEYLRLAGLLSGLIGNVGGGGGSGQTGTYTPGGRGLDPIFSAKLPTANIPGGVGTASNFAARPMGEEDWLTYATRPERSFFNYVPEPVGMAEGGAFAAKRGGQSQRTEFAVNGPGTGRSDDIPAVLSDGEYVMDAETVALLGDGSSKAGAKKLDELRVKVRKHKGQKLAKGRFSANAKRPEAYLSGGRV